MINLVVLYRLSSLQIPELTPLSSAALPTERDMSELDEAGWARLVASQAAQHQARAEKMRIGLETAVAAVATTEKVICR